MLAQVLALHLALLDPAATPQAIHVLPPLELATSRVALADATPGGPAGEAAASQGNAAPGTTPAAPQVVRADPRRGVVMRGYGGALLGTVASDLVFVGLFALAASNLDFFRDSRSDEAWAVVFVASAIGFTFLTPAATVWGAQRAEGYERPGLAYAAVFAVRVAGFLAAAGFPPIALVTELVAAPLVAAAVAASGTPIGRRAAPPPDFPDEPAPEALPGPAGPRISRPLCPDPALALR